MSALTTRDTLDALTRIRAYVEGLDAFYDGDEPFVREDVIDTVDGSPQSSALLLSDLRAIASGAVIDAATLADDEAVVDRFIAALGQWPANDGLRDTTRRVARTYLRALAAALAERGAQ